MLILSPSQRNVYPTILDTLTTLAHFRHLWIAQIDYYSEKGKMKELTMEERAKIAAELAERYGQDIATSSSELYMEEPAVIGVALAYLDCGCILLSGFEESGNFVGGPKTFATRDFCSGDHTRSLDGITQAAVYNSILWKETQEEFDRKYGNEKRIEIATKLFPPQVEE